MKSSKKNIKYTCKMCGARIYELCPRCITDLKIAKQAVEDGHTLTVEEFFEKYKKEIKSREAEIAE